MPDQINALYMSYDGATEPLGQSQIIAYLEELAKYGIRFNLVTFDKPFFLKNKQRIAQLHDILARQNIDWTYLQYHKYPLVLATVYDLLNGLIVVIKFVIKKKIKIIHARSYPSALVALMIKKMFKLKFIFDMRGFWADERVDGKVWGNKRFLYYFVKFLEKHFLRSADEIVVLTKRAKEIIKDWGYKTDNVSVIPCCVNTDHFKFNGESRAELREKYNLDNKFVFTHTGSLEYWYMKEEMLDYFKVAGKITPNAHFLILTHSDKNIIINLILRKGLSLDNFSFLSVPYTQMPVYLSLADVGLFFITPVFSKLASSPTKFAEYLSCGIPVIINNKIGDLEDCVEENNIGVVVREFSDIEYKRSLEKLLNLSRDADMKLRCRKVACDNFSIEKGVAKYAQIYARLR